MMSIFVPSVTTEYLQYQPFPLAMLRPVEADFYPGKLIAPSLDIGCGDGFFAHAVFGQRGITVGIDPDANVLKKARAGGAYERILHFDGAHIPLQSSTFRSVTANCVLEHVDHPEALLQEIGRVTKQNGIFYFTTPTVHFDEMLLGSRLLHASHLTLLAYVYERFMDRVTRQKYYWTKDQWVKVFHDTGFTLVRHKEFFGPRALAVFDISHWLSIPSIATKLLTGRWILLPELRWKISLLNRVRNWAMGEKDSVGAFQFFSCKKQ